MIAEFIGQGLFDDTEESIGNHVCSTLNNLTFKQITFFNAFLRSKGLKELKPFIKKAQKNGASFTFFIGIDEKITSKEALEMLLELGIDSYVYSSKQFIYHPKVYVFEGEIRSRIITGSSNLTKSGLFYNIESSILLDFTNEDKGGNKVLNQLKDYFSPLLEFTSDNLEKVTEEYIAYLVEESLISIEKYESEEDSFLKTHDNTKKRFKNPKIGTLGKIEITESARQSKKYKFKITEEYLEKWNGMFKRMKAYKEEFGRTTVSKNHVDQTLIGWYYKQKLIYNDPELEMPKEHLEKLESIDFHFGDGKDERTDFIRKRWLKLLQKALRQGEEISQIHSYIFEGENLGTWLQESKKDIETRALIEKAGFDYNKKSRSPKNSAIRFLSNLEEDLNPKKSKYQTLFNSRIIHRKDKIPDYLINEINKLWKQKFKENRSWIKKSRVKDYTEEWKKFRNNKSINPEGKWFKPKPYMGNIYEWVWGKRKNKSKMDLVIDKFNQEELKELKNEGFPIE
ncbi:phospholipase D-like domain-containing protein [uncultured Winogradskyella sp.]|uniref:helicase associated domain-containing protein n=1 Tax=uncultured Winogradskyella sp. TaxID=395353 RepID=UPI0030EC1C2D|tara:strand:- start:2014 stop:3546 length:1533 start_codon:yes stop_codon:yes gene_type:complete